MPNADKMTSAYTICMRCETAKRRMNRKSELIKYRNKRNEFRTEIIPEENNTSFMRYYDSCVIDMGNGKLLGIGCTQRMRDHAMRMN